METLPQDRLEVSDKPGMAPAHPAPAGKSAALKLMIADDHALVREALEQRFSLDPRFRIVGTAPDAGAAVELVASTRPDILLMDTEMPGGDPFEAARTIRERMSGVRVVFLSARLQDAFVERALLAGAHGFVTKHDSFREIGDGLVEVGAGRFHFSLAVRSRVVVDHHGARMTPDHASWLTLLTPRETEVLRSIAQGKTKREIAETMSLSHKTIEKHTDNLMTKLKIHDRVDLTRFAIREGLASA